MGKLERLDIDVSLDSSFGKQEPNLIDIYEKKEEASSTPKNDDEMVSFSANLVKCFKSKIKASPVRLRVDSLIETYKSAEESYTPNSDHTLSIWCMANVNRFLSVAEGKDFNVSAMDTYVAQAKEELEELNLDFNFKSVHDLYIETRKESIKNAMNYRLEREF